MSESRLSGRDLDRVFDEDHERLLALEQIPFDSELVRSGKSLRGHIRDRRSLDAGLPIAWALGDLRAEVKPSPADIDIDRAWRVAFRRLDRNRGAARAEAVRVKTPVAHCSAAGLERRKINRQSRDRQGGDAAKAHGGSGFLLRGVMFEDVVFSAKAETRILFC